MGLHGPRGKVAPLESQAGRLRPVLEVVGGEGNQSATQAIVTSPLTVDVVAPVEPDKPGLLQIRGHGVVRRLGPTQTVGTVGNGHLLLVGRALERSTGLERRDDLWEARAWDHTARCDAAFRARHVVLAIGRGVPRRFDIPGNTDGIAYRLDDPVIYAGRPACVIGGVSIMGGIGSVLGALLGALFLGIIANALPVVNISPFWQMAISGGAIIIAVVLNAQANRTPGRIILKRAEHAT